MRARSIVLLASIATCLRVGEENHDPLAFALEIATDGRITITGCEPSPVILDQP